MCVHCDSKNYHNSNTLITEVMIGVTECRTTNDLLKVAVNWREEARNISWDYRCYGLCPLPVHGRLG